jgi:acetylornithine deacetylase
MIMDVFELTRRLISIPSISGDEKEVAHFLADYLEARGFTVELQDAGDDRPNVYARRGDPDVVLSSHTDTVPPLIEEREDDDFIYGRGACDAKGIIAAMIKAAESLIEQNVSDFGLLLVVGEEAGSPGARAANEIPTRCRYLINGEPTESKLALGSKGALRAVLRAEGRAAHSAYPHLGESAINKLLDALARLRAVKFPENEKLGATTMNIGVIRGGAAANVIAAEAEAEILLRIVTDTCSIKNIIEETISDWTGIRYKFECEPVFMEEMEGYETSVVAFTTDIPLLTNWGRPLLFGPGSILDAHTANEKISKTELLRAVASYTSMVMRLKENHKEGSS